MGLFIGLPHKHPHNQKNFVFVKHCNIETTSKMMLAGDVTMLVSDVFHGCKKKPIFFYQNFFVAKQKHLLLTS